MKRLLSRIGIRAMTALGIVVDEVYVVTRADVVVILGRVNERRFLMPAPGGVQ
jgi:hypothetical protein